MKTHSSRRTGWRHGVPGRQSGVSIVLVSLALFMLLAFTALAVDGGNLYVARNELHNAADAGALAGARFLYVEDGSQVNDGTQPYDGVNYKSANAWATEAAQSNDSQNETVEVVSALRGHWSFTDRTFTPNPSLAPVDLAGKTTQELDLDPNFINAVEVVTARDQTPVEAFFGRVLGFDNYEASARAVAYLGFAGKLMPGDVDQPIAMCRSAVTSPSGEYDCNVGRFISDNDQTGGWTDFNQEANGGSDVKTLKDMIEEGSGNPNELEYGEDISTNNGQANSAFKLFYDKWVEKTSKQAPWSMTLPVVDCSANLTSSAPLVGAVNLNVLWVNANQPKVEDNAPEKMYFSGGEIEEGWPGDWEAETTDPETNWTDFVDQDHFNLQSPEGEPAEWRSRSIYFLPSCSYQEPTGGTGGENYGILAKIPVLVD